MRALVRDYLTIKQCELLWRVSHWALCASSSSYVSKLVPAHFFCSVIQTNLKCVAKRAWESVHTLRYCVVNEVTEESVRCHFENPKREQDPPSSSSALPRRPRKPKNTHHFWIICHQSPWWPQSHLEHNVRHRTSTQTDTLACWNICTHNNSLFVSKLDFLLIIISCVNSGKTLGGQAPACVSHYQHCLQVCVCVCV